jgi:hypothetical protein
MFDKALALARRYWWLLAAVLAVLGVTVSQVDRDGDGKPDEITITVTQPAPKVTTVDTADPNTKRDTAVVLSDRARDAYQAVAAEDRSELADQLREPNDPSRTAPGVLEGPLAAQEFPGCRTRFVGNYSSRNGVSPKIIVWHQTVSRERGIASQDALTAYANRRSSGVSWHLLIGRTNGLCTFSVPLTMKAWTQGNANPFSIGIEVEAYGDEPTYVSGLGERRLLAVTRELGRRYGIPMRKGLVQNCRVVRSGVVEHSDLGACGGGHADVTPWPTAVLLEQLAAGTIATATERRRCNALAYHRRKVKSGTGYWTRSRVQRVRYLKGALTRAGIDQAACR